MHINFCIPFVYCSASSKEAESRVLRILADTMVSLDQEYLASHSTVAPSHGGVNYGKPSMRWFRPPNKMTHVQFDLPFYCANSTQESDSRVLKILLEALIALNLVYLTTHKVIPLLDCGVFYARTQVWDTIPALRRRGYGDCKSLTADQVAEYRNRGIEANPVFRWARPENKTDTNYHILVQTARGFEDPSKVLGMNAHAIY